MDFYTEQDVARRKAWVLLLFIIAVVILIGITNILIAALIYVLGEQNSSACLVSRL